VGDWFGIGGLLMVEAASKTNPDGHDKSESQNDTHIALLNESRRHESSY
jgi:hypothetical protein